MAKPKGATYSIITAVMILATAMVARAARADTVSTSFEGLGPGTFTVGTSPISASFAGGRAQTVGNSDFYHSGSFSWHVSAGSIATITFETPASSVDLWYRDTPGGAGEVRAIDTGSVVVGISAFRRFTSCWRNADCAH